MPGVCIDAIPIAGASSDASEGFGTANRSGFYKIASLVPGRYKVFFGDRTCLTDPGGLAPQWYSGKASSSAAKIITVRADRTARAISAVLRPDGWISGLVTGPANAALTGICVRAVPVAGGLSPLLTTTAADGHYLLGPLDPGRYRLKFSVGCGATGFATQWWDHARTAAKATAVLVRAGRTHQAIDATMTPASP